MTLRDSNENENGIGHTLVWKPQRLCPPHAGQTKVYPTTPNFRTTWSQLLTANC